MIFNFNINDEVTVTLNETGISIYRDWMKERDADLDKIPSNNKLKKRFQLWELIEIFGGKKMSLSSPTPFVNNELQIIART